MKSAFNIACIVLASVTLLLSVLGIIGLWVVQSSLSEAAVNALANVEDAAGVARGGIERVDSRVASARELANAVQTRASEISQEVAATGVARTALPEEMVERFDARVSSVSDTVEDTRDRLLAIIHVVRALDNTARVDLPEPDPARAQRAEEAVTSLRNLREELQQEVGDFRAGVSSKINRVVEIAARIDARLAETQDNLSQVDGQLPRRQSSADSPHHSVSHGSDIHSAASLGWIQSDRGAAESSERTKLAGGQVWRWKLHHQALPMRSCFLW
jgi:hypothetical protein